MKSCRPFATVSWPTWSPACPPEDRQRYRDALNVADETVARTGNTADRQEGFADGLDEGRRIERHNAALRVQLDPANAARYITLRAVLTDATGAGVLRMTAAMEHLDLPQTAYPTADQLDAMMDYITANPTAGVSTCSCPDACGQRTKD
ncbi:hypothetical protein [Achromobacter marplatensis]|uniref:hypothetical protein n=1 Tax=Achromobacter marplatensis TaxID=470868 RepID=UPI0028E99A4C|nr:hypothetical protein [Achromobacter marplatensis]